MSQKGQGEKPPAPIPPRRSRSSAPSAATPGDVTPASGPPSIARRTRGPLEPEPPTSSGRVPRPSGSVGPEARVPPPRITIRDTGTGTQGSVRAVPDAGPSAISSRMSRHVSERRVTIQDISLGSTAPGKALRAAGTSPSPEKASRASGPEALPKATVRDAETSTPPKKSALSPRLSNPDTRPSTSDRAKRDSGSAISPRATARASSLDSSPRKVSIEEPEPSTSARGSKKEATKKPSLKQRLNIFKKKKTAASDQRPSMEPERLSVVAEPQHRVKSNRILYTTDEEVRDALVEFSVFIIFLILTSLVTLSVRHKYMFYFNDTMKKLFTTRELVIAPSVTVSFEKLITVPDWWDYLFYNFLVTLHGDMTFLEDRPENHTAPSETTDDKEEDVQRPNAKLVMKPPQKDLALNKLVGDSPYNWDPGVEWVPGARVPRHGEHEPNDNSTYESPHHLEGRVFLYENLLLGPPRIRQIRVRRESCYVNDAFVRYFNTCYAAYSSAAEDRNDVYQGSPYRTMNDLDTMPLWTLLNYYRTGGYVVDLTYEKERNLAIITELKEAHWLDRGSRLCLVEFNLFNENTDVFQSVKLIAEIPPTGGVIPQAQLQTVKQYSFFTDRSMVMTVIYIFWYIMIVYYTINEILELRKSGFKNYIYSMLNVLDCFILLLCYSALIYNVWHYVKVTTVTEKARQELTYQSLDLLCFWNIIYVDTMAILSFLVWIKIFKFISFNKTLVQFTTTLKRCSKDLAGFSLMFGIVFLAYAQLGLLLFGTKHPDFRNFITSILTMIRMILGDFQYNLIEQANRVLGPIYFLTYILLVFFILLNMFLAIIMETYNTVKGEITQGRSQLGSYIYKKLAGVLYFISHCGRKRRARPELTAEEAEEAEQEKMATQEEPEETRKHLTAAQAKYFQEIPPGENKDFARLNNRVALMEEILEKLINNMDDILKRVERERSHKRKSSTL